MHCSSLLASPITFAEVKDMHKLCQPLNVLNLMQLLAKPADNSCILCAQQGPLLCQASALSGCQTASALHSHIDCPASMLVRISDIPRTPYESL